jgi:hypothetical protein
MKSIENTSTLLSGKITGAFNPIYNTAQSRSFSNYHRVWNTLEMRSVFHSYKESDLVYRVEIRVNEICSRLYIKEA